MDDFVIFFTSNQDSAKMLLDKHDLKEATKIEDLAVWLSHTTDCITVHKITTNCHREEDGMGIALDASVKRV